jgi:hypothetical protein
LQAWQEAGDSGKIGSLLLGAGQIEALEVVASEML